MTQDDIILYHRPLTMEGDQRDTELWTIFRNQDGLIREAEGYVQATDLGHEVRFISIRAMMGWTRSDANEFITEKRLFEGFSIYPQLYRLDRRALSASPAPDARPVAGTEGEFLPGDPVLNPSSQSLGSPHWFF